MGAPRGAEPGRSLHLGCGTRKQPGTVGVDRVRLREVDVLWDLNRRPYPFRSNSFDSVYLVEILEHLDDVYGVLAEVQRLCRPGADVFITTPHFSSVNAYSDPTHKHYFSTHALDNCIWGRESFQFYTDLRFELVEISLGIPGAGGPLRRIAHSFINRFQSFYEKHLIYLFPVHALYFHLRVAKKSPLEGDEGAAR